MHIEQGSRRPISGASGGHDIGFGEAEGWLAKQRLDCGCSDMKDELDSVAGQEVLGEGGENPTRGTLVPHRRVPGPAQCDSPPRTPNGIDRGAFGDMRIGHAINPSSGADVVDRVDR